ncbi:DUF2306 domain-containing protein [Cryptosporangium japonicum]|uniref:Membrane protein DUF2306 n=1 Tax=Cryptosporangium japonicum TaxID=80872 RepID=A0ABN0TLB4_9ACTN
MTMTAPRIRRAAAGWWLGLSALAIAVFAPLPYLTTPLAELAADDAGLAANYVDRPAVVQVFFYLHVVSGGTALLLSPVQLSALLRRRVPAVHRVVGRVTFAAIGVGGVAGAVLAPFNEAGPVGTAGFGLLALAWLGCAGAAYSAIRRRDVAAHRRWAIRTFALTYAGVMLRLWLGVLIVAGSGLAGLDDADAFALAYPAAAFLCWVPNLLLAEWLLRRRHPLSPRT